MPSTVSCLGIDLASSPTRASAYAVLQRDASLLQVGTLRSDEEILSLARQVWPAHLAIDAPLSLPRGMCCLEPSCPCTAQAADGLRVAERDLIRRGFGLFRTTKKSIIKALVYRAIPLRRQLKEAGFRVLEVYPYASKVILLGRPLPGKTTPEGRALLRARLERIIPRLFALDRALSHDELDAIVAAYTGYLFAGGQAEAVGDEAEGTICLPRAAAAVPSETPA